MLCKERMLPVCCQCVYFQIKEQTKSFIVRIKLSFCFKVVKFIIEHELSSTDPYVFDEKYENSAFEA